MGFSCEIYQGRKSLTDNDFISYKLFDLAPSNSEHSDAPYRLEDLRAMVSDCIYGSELPEAAQDCFRRLQSMVRSNLESLLQCHCDTCKCPPKKPRGWSVEAIKRLLSVDANTITRMHGGY